MSVFTKLTPTRNRLPLRGRIVILGLLVVLGPLTVDLYLPAFPAVQADLGVGAASVQLTLTMTMVGFGVGQLIVGPWSDSVGRRRPLLLTSAVHIVASIGVALAPDLAWLLVFRLLQGVGAAGSAVVATAAVRDLYDGKVLVRMLARLALITGVAPVVAPILGSQLLSVLDWRGLFVAVAAYGVTALLLAATLLSESLPKERRHERSAGGVGRFGVLLRDRAFVGVALIGGLLVAGVFSYLSASAFVLQSVYGVGTQQYGWLFAANSVGFAVGAQLGARLLLRRTPQWLLSRSLPVLATLGFGVAFAGLLPVGLVGVLVPTFLFLFIAGVSVPGLQVLGLMAHGDRAGTAAAVLGATNSAVPGLLSPIVGVVGVNSVIPMGVMMGCTITVAIVVLRVFVARPVQLEQTPVQC